MLLIDLKILNCSINILKDSSMIRTVLRKTDKLCIVSNHRQFSTNIQIKIIKLIPDLILDF